MTAATGTGGMSGLRQTEIELSLIKAAASPDHSLQVDLFSSLRACLFFLSAKGMRN